MNTRQGEIKKLEDILGARVITYITGETPPFKTQVAADVVPLLGEQLAKIGKSEKIALFLQTSGGDMLAPVRIAKLIRGYCDKFQVVVPYRAHSAGTLICLGADEILMGPLGELTPVDPSMSHPFNPSHPQDANKKLEISVEDLNSFILYAKDKAKIGDEQMIEAYKILAEKIHPLSIGAAYRAFRMIKILAEKLLCLHMDKDKEKERIEKIIKDITEDITIHAYPIDSEEAKSLGLKISGSYSEEADSQAKKLLGQYMEEMKFNPGEILGSDEAKNFEHSAAYLETTDLAYQFKFSGRVQKVIRDNKPAIDVNINPIGWQKI